MKRLNKNQPSDEKDEWIEEIKKLKEKGVKSPKELGLIDIPNSLKNKHHN